MPDSFAQLGENLVAFLPNLLAAIAILVIGWIVALLISRVVGNLLHRTNIDDRLASSLKGGTPERIPVERWISTAVFWLIMAFVIVIFLQTLDLGEVSAPLNLLLAQVLGFIPNLVAAALLALLAFVIATVLRMIITRVVGSSLFTQRITEGAQVEPASRVNMGQTIGNVVFWLVLLLFLPAILDALDLGGLLAPVQSMVDGILSAIPAVFAALILLVFAYFIARFVGTLVSSLLSGIGFNRLFGPGGVIPVTGVATFPTQRSMVYPAEEEPPSAVRRMGEPGAITPGRTTPAQIVGTIVTIAIILFAAMEAANLLGFETLTAIIAGFIAAAGNILVGLVILGIGLYLANLADRLIRSTGSSQANILAPAAKVAIIIFSGALALRQMGIGEDIVNLAFGLMLGAVAVAAAIAFGIGGRDIAARLLERWRDNLEVEASKPPRPAPPPPARPTTTPPVTPTPPSSSDLTGGPTSMD